MSISDPGPDHVTVVIDASPELDGKVAITFGPMDAGDVRLLFEQIAERRDEFIGFLLDHVTTAIIGLPRAAWPDGDADDYEDDGQGTLW